MRKTYTAGQVAAALMAAPDERHWGRSLSKATGVPTGSLVGVLARMREAGWLADGWEIAAEAHAEGRPPRHYYEVTPQGREALTAMLAEAVPRAKTGAERHADWLRRQKERAAGLESEVCRLTALADSLRAALGDANAEISRLPPSRCQHPPEGGGVVGIPLPSLPPLGIEIVADERMPEGVAALVVPDHDGKLQVQAFPVGSLRDQAANRPY